MNGNESASRHSCHNVAGDGFSGSAAVFATTHWSVVLSARDKNSPRSEEALETLCRAYWYPLYVFTRRQGHGPHDAEDLTQGFFARLLEKDYLHSVSQEKGRFRTFLLLALKRFLANEWDRQQARKRGGGLVVIPLDTALAENRYQTEASLVMASEAAYDRQWAVTLLDQSLLEVQKEYAQSGKEREFKVMKDFLTPDKQTIPYAQLAVQLGHSEAAARMAVHRLRRRYREIYREKIAQTLAHPAETEEEMRYLLQACYQA